MGARLEEVISVMAKSKFSKIWDEKMSRRIEGLLDQGGTFQEAARLMGIDRSTFHRWMKGTDKEKAAFRIVVNIGKEASEAWWIRQGRENLETRGFNHALWLINMVNRFGWRSTYSKKEEHKEVEHKGTVEVKKRVDVDSILEKAVNKGLEQIEKSIH
tara:strand:+ start:1051 stop:1524 length:474 start_codon:yes stop_codon:yes gene_type:complete